jgi:hypothetical protein
MTAGPLLTRLLEMRGRDAAARVLGFIAFNWMGIVFLAFCSFLLAGACDLILWPAEAFTRIRIPSLHEKFPTIAILLFVAALSVYSFLEARSLRIERVRIESGKLPSSTERLKIVQISDLHLGLLNRDGRIKTILERIRAEAPDLVVSTGDLVDGNVESLHHLEDIFRKVEAGLGKFAVTGNHEAYAGLDASVALTGSFGFTVLRGEARTIGSIINIVGVDDPVFGGREEESRLLSSLQNGLFTLLLKHRPEISEESPGLFDLQLSGHTHRGQIYPFKFVVALQYPLMDGLYRLAKGSILYASRGTGSWGPQMRLFSPPELTVIELTRPGAPPSGDVEASLS